MFDSPAELLRKIQLAEDSSLELKTIQFRDKSDKISAPHRDSLADELAAMANTTDAVLVLGVDDKTKEIFGIPQNRLDSVESYVREICNDSIDPPLMVRTSWMELPDYMGTPRIVLKVDVPRSLFVHKSPGGYFFRQGSSKREMSPDYLARLFQQRSQARLIRFEEQAVPGTRMKDLKPELWQRFTARSDEKPEVVLLKRNLLSKTESGQVCTSVAGVLMAAEHPEQYLPSAFIEAVSYRGEIPDSNEQLDAHKLYGPLDSQIEQAMAFLRRNQKIAARKAPDRIELPQFSERAVFEAVVNAVAHRDYSIHGSKIRFFMFSDRLEIYSPGALPNTVTVDSIDLRQATRNELLTSLLAECKVQTNQDQIARRYYMEKRGEGVPIILNESFKLSGRKPEYRLIDDSELLLTIYSADTQIGQGSGYEV